MFRNRYFVIYNENENNNQTPAAADQRYELLSISIYVD